MKEKIYSGILGLCVADALGVPVEFCTRTELGQNPVTDMRAFGTHNQPAGTWSDDTSMTLCLLKSLSNRLDYDDIMHNFLAWVDDGKFAAHGVLFDIGIGTHKAIRQFAGGQLALLCGGQSEYDNGNGSLMRILPLVFYLNTSYGDNFIKHPDSFIVIHDVSKLTHAHKRSLIGCGIYISVSGQLLINTNLENAIGTGLQIALQHYSQDVEYSGELKHYSRLFDPNFKRLPQDAIKSSGYIVDTLEAAIWCLLNTNNYKDCVLKAVNLGEDTDTVAAVSGGLAGMHYGSTTIPKNWVKQIARHDYIKDLCEEFYYSLNHE